MFRLLHRISSSFSGRFERTQNESSSDRDTSAPSSSTPQTGSKRRMSDDDEEQSGSLSKRSRAHDSARTDELGNDVSTPNEQDLRESSKPPGLTRTDTEEVRQVTKGVKEVELEDKKDKGREEVVAEEPEDGENDGPVTEKNNDTSSKDLRSGEMSGVEKAPDATHDDGVANDTQPEPLKNDDTDLDAEGSSDTPDAMPESRATVDTISETKGASDSAPSGTIAETPASNSETVPERLATKSVDESTAKAEE